MILEGILPEFVASGIVILFGTVLTIGILFHIRSGYHQIKKDILDVLKQENELEGAVTNETGGDDRVDV